MRGSGKSTVASAVERELDKQGVKKFILDGNNLRMGNNSNLDFNATERIISDQWIFLGSKYVGTILSNHTKWAYYSDVQVKSNN